MLAADLIPWPPFKDELDHSAKLSLLSDIVRNATCQPAVLAAAWVSHPAHSSGRPASKTGRRGGSSFASQSRVQQLRQRDLWEPRLRRT